MGKTTSVSTERPAIYAAGRSRNDSLLESAGYQTIELVYTNSTKPGT
ncbi:hypothetical protein ABIB14_003261 [Arthrobacter sp. UYEF3]